METLIIQRERSTDKGTAGEMLRNGSHLCYTMELPWLGNRLQISCIPAGRYVVKKRFSVKYKNHWHVQDVPERSFILIHQGNTIKDIQGCILVGNRRGVITGLPAVLGSRETMDMLRATLPDEFILEVRS